MFTTTEKSKCIEIWILKIEQSWLTIVNHVRNKIQINLPIYLLNGLISRFFLEQAPVVERVDNFIKQRDKM